MTEVVLEEIAGRTWYCIESDTLFSCCREAERLGYCVEDRVRTGFLLHKHDSNEYSTITSFGDINFWELIHFNYKPDFNEPRIMPDWNS